MSDTFDSMWSALQPVGRDPRTGGYRRFALTREDHDLREWFAEEAVSRRLDLTVDRAGNQWAWWGDPDAAAAAGRPGVVVGSHLDSVPDGGAYDGPLGVVSAFAALDALRGEGFAPARPLGIVSFCDEEGARFGVACTGSRVLTGAMTPERALALADDDGRTMADALRTAGRRPEDLAADPETVRRVGCFVELHVEQGRGLVDLDRPVAVGTQIWPHGRWRFDFAGQANHAGTTRLADRQDAMLGLAATVLATRERAAARGCLATIGKVEVRPGGVNAIAGAATAWLDARGPVEADVQALVADLTGHAAERYGAVREESWTGPTDFDTDLTARLARLLDAPLLATGAGHDAGILTSAGIPATMLFVRNPTGVSHSPEEYARPDDCRSGVAALTRGIRELAG